MVIHGSRDDLKGEPDGSAEIAGSLRNDYWRKYYGKAAIGKRMDYAR